MATNADYLDSIITNVKAISRDFDKWDNDRNVDESDYMTDWLKQIDEKLGDFRETLEATIDQRTA